MRTIKSSREIDSIFKESRRAGSPLLTALARNTPKERGLSGRVAFVAGKRIGNAVVRNRAKRVMREAARRGGAPWASFDVVLIAKAGLGNASAGDVDRAIRTVTNRLGIT